MKLYSSPVWKHNQAVWKHTNVWNTYHVVWIYTVVWNTWTIAHSNMRVPHDAHWSLGYQYFNGIEVLVWNWSIGKKNPIETNDHTMKLLYWYKNISTVWNRCPWYGNNMLVWNSTVLVWGFFQNVWNKIKKYGKCFFTKIDIFSYHTYISHKRLDENFDCFSLMHAAIVMICYSYER